MNMNYIRPVFSRNARTRLIVSATVFGGILAMPATAWAAETASEAEVPVTDNGEIAEIVVTAEKRVGSSQKTAASISVLTADDAAQVARPQDLTKLVPGLQIGATGGAAQVYIRGVGDQSTNLRAQPGVSLNLDGISLLNGSQFATSFFDVQRVEVLKGPQGTLYGRNSTGGAINVITNLPKLGNFGGSAQVSAGNYSMVNAEAAVNLPVGDAVAVRLAGQVVTRDGYLSNGGDDQKTWALRGKILFQPSDAVSLLITGDASHIGGVGNGAVFLPYNGGNPWTQNTSTPLRIPFQFNAATAPYTTPNDQATDTDIRGISGEFNADLGFAKLTVLGSYRSHKSFIVTYGTNFRFSEVYDGHATSLEARLAGSNDVLDWLVGGYYFDNPYFSELDPTQNTTVLAVQFDQTIRSKAAFGQVTVKLTPEFRATGGLRYSDETIIGTFTTGSGALPLIKFTPSGAPKAFALGTDKLNWRAGLQYDVGPQSMLYANASTGFKGGGVSESSACGGQPWNPENITAFDVGTKNRFFGNRLQVNAEAFLWKYKDQQVSFLGQDPCGGVAFVTLNAGRSTIKGASVDITWRATDADTIRLAGEYVDGQYDKFVFSQFGLGAFGPTSQSLCTRTPIGGPVNSIDCSGAPLTRQPKWTLQGQYSHKFTLTDGATITPQISGQAAGSRYLDIGFGPNGLVPSYIVGDADITYRDANDNFWFSLFVRNFTNEAYYLSGINCCGAAPNRARFYSAAIAAPRTYGIRTGFKF
jgi:iron complex outermembrane recepter protein